MEKEFMEYLRENEQVRWEGKPAEFPLMEEVSRKQILRTWILTVAVCAALLGCYLSRFSDYSVGFIGIVIIVGCLVIASPFLERGGLQKCRYWITDQRVILMARDKSFYWMELSAIDEFQLVQSLTVHPCLVLGGEIFEDVPKQLRWRACHPKMDLQGCENEDCAVGLILYNVENVQEAVALLESRPRKEAA